MQEENLTIFKSWETKIDRQFLSNYRKIKDDDIIKFSLFLYINFMGKHEKTSEYIKEISNGFFISGGLNNIFVYNGIVEPKKMKKIKKDNKRILEIKGIDKFVELIIYSDNEINRSSINNNLITPIHLYILFGKKK